MQRKIDKNHFKDIVHRLTASNYGNLQRIELHANDENTTITVEGELENSYQMRVKEVLVKNPKTGLFEEAELTIQQHEYLRKELQNEVLRAYNLHDQVEEGHQDPINAFESLGSIDEVSIDMY